MKVLVLLFLIYGLASGVLHGGDWVSNTVRVPHDRQYLEINLNCTGACELWLFEVERSSALRPVLYLHSSGTTFRQVQRGQYLYKYRHGAVSVQTRNTTWSELGVIFTGSIIIAFITWGLFMCVMVYFGL